MSFQSHRCPRCMREFARAEHLVRHERTHTKEKPYKCRLCSQAFSRQDLLRRHNIKAHGCGAASAPAIEYAPISETTHFFTKSRHSDHPEDIPGNHHSRASPSRTPPTVSRLTDVTAIEDTDPSSSVNAFPPGPLTDIPGMWIPDLMPEVLPASFLDSRADDNTSLVDTFGWLDCGAKQPPPHQLIGNFALGPFEIPATQEMPLDQFHAVPSHTHHDSHCESQLDSHPDSQHGGMPLASMHVSGGPSILDMPGSDDGGMATITSPTNISDLSLTDERWQFLEQQTAQMRQVDLPSRDALGGFISRYFNSFHRHQPFLHEPTWSPSAAPPYLILAVCANGAVYSLENTIAVDLFHLAADMLPPAGHGLCILQTMMLLAAFASWSGNGDDLQLAIQLHGQMPMAMRREWALLGADIGGTPTSWPAWLARENLKRITCCVFTVTTLMAVAFDLPPTFALDAEHGMPSQESLWCAATEDQFLRTFRDTEPQRHFSADEIVRQLFDQDLPIPSHIGMFGCHVIISTLLQKILFLQRSFQGCEDAMVEVRPRFLLALKRWQIMWESEPEASLSPYHPRGPILFNCTAILRLAYIRLVANYAPIRRAFTFLSSPEQIAARLDACVGPQRNSETAMAALQACLALRIPTQMGFKVIARTSFWVWSVQHSLSYFECALLLSQWLQLTEHLPYQDQTPDERGIISMVEQMLSPSKTNSSAVQGKLPLSVAILLRWAELLDTGDTTVWEIMPGMARVLRVRAEMALATGSMGAVSDTQASTMLVSTL